MKTSSRIIAAMLATAIAAPAIAIAQETPRPASPAAAQADRQEARPGGPRAGRDHGRSRPSGLWNVASRLAAAELALGITPAQQEAWSVFAGAAIAFAEAGRPMRGASPHDAAGRGEPADRQAPDRGPLARAERMLDRSIARGEAADALKGAMSTLAAQLSPEQTATAERLLRELPGHGRDGRGWHRHGRG